MVFINTNRYWDPSNDQLNFFSYHNKSKSRQIEQKYYRFVFPGGKFLSNSVFIETRYMKNIFSLIQGYEYFTVGAFTYKLSLFFIMDSNKQMTTQEIYYHFYYGDLYGTIDHSLSNRGLEDCLHFTPDLKMNYSKHLAAYCAVIDLSNLKKLSEKINNALLIYGPIGMTVYNEDL